MANYLWLVVVLIVLWEIIRNRRTAAAAWKIQNRRKQNQEEILAMRELAKQFIGEECVIYTITSNEGSIKGVIKAVEDGGLIVERRSGERELVNLDFVTRIRRCAGKKNGRK